MSSRALRKLRNEDDLPSPEDEDEDEVTSPVRNSTGANAFSLVNINLCYKGLFLNRHEQ